MNVKVNDKGLIPAIAQDVNTGKVLMLGYMNAGTLKRTLEGGQVWFYSRSQEDLWHKGEICLLYNSPSQRDKRQSRMQSSE